MSGIAINIAEALRSAVLAERDRENIPGKNTKEKIQEETCVENKIILGDIAAFAH